MARGSNGGELARQLEEVTKHLADFGEAVKANTQSTQREKKAKDESSKSGAAGQALESFGAAAVGGLKSVANQPAFASATAALASGDFVSAQGNIKLAALSAFNNLNIAGLPVGQILGAATGATQFENAMASAQGRSNAIFDDIARAGIKVSDRDMQAQVDFFIKQEQAVQESRKRVAQRIGENAEKTIDNALADQLIEFQKLVEKIYELLKQGIASGRPN